MSVNFTTAIEEELVNEIALTVLHGDFKPSYDNQYQLGYLDGYARVWTKFTGKTVHQLIAAVNKAISGSGKSLDERA